MDKEPSMIQGEMKKKIGLYQPISFFREGGANMNKVFIRMNLVEEVHIDTSSEGDTVTAEFFRERSRVGVKGLTDTV